MYGGMGDTPVYGPTASQLGIETVQGDLNTQIQGASPAVQTYISNLEGWINASGSSSTSTTPITTYLAVGAVALVTLMVLFGGGRR